MQISQKVECARTHTRFAAFGKVAPDFFDVWIPSNGTVQLHFSQNCLSWLHQIIFQALDSSIPAPGIHPSILFFSDLRWARCLTFSPAGTMASTSCYTLHLDTPVFKSKASVDFWSMKIREHQHCWRQSMNSHISSRGLRQPERFVLSEGRFGRDLLCDCKDCSRFENLVETGIEKGFKGWLVRT